MGPLSVSQIEGNLPPGFERLIEAARAEGVRNMDLLSEGWRAGSQRFDRDGAALFGAFRGDALVGVGGVTPQAGHPEPAMRMRRFYVHPDARRSGAGRRLAEAAMAQGFVHVALLTCNARATPLAPPFWESMGFIPADLATITHLCRRG